MSGIDRDVSGILWGFMLPPFLTSFSALLLIAVLLAIVTYFFATRLVNRQAAARGSRPQSLFTYYGYYAALWAFVPAIMFLLVWTLASTPFVDASIKQVLSDAFPDISGGALDLKLAQVQNISAGLIAAPDAMMTELAIQYGAALNQASVLRFSLTGLIGLAGLFYALMRIRPDMKARNLVERFAQRVLFLAAVIAILTTIGIVASLLFEAIRFFSQYSFFDFFFGTHWSPNTAMRSGADEDVGGSSGSFGMIPVLAGTMLVALIAMLVALPIGLFAAIYTSEFASRRVRNMVKPTLEILAGVPTIVYGFFAALTAAPFFRSIGLTFGLDVSSQSALAAGAVMGVMIIPFISSLSDDVITAVPQSLRDGSYGLGATHGETIIRVVLPAAFPGLVGAFLLAISRAVGETMIVVMAAGVSANLTANPLESVTTVTVQIVMLLTGDTEFTSLKTLSAFALGITLFTATLLLNIAALTISRRLGQRYE